MGEMEWAGERRRTGSREPQRIKGTEQENWSRANVRTLPGLGWKGGMSQEPEFLHSI